jgi:hypothetical protein
LFSDDKKDAINRRVRESHGKELKKKKK